VADRPPYDSWLRSLHRAMLIGIGERLKVEWATSTDLPPALEDTLKRVKEEKDKLESDTKVYL
jgi:hypothetical protein